MGIRHAAGILCLAILAQPVAAQEDIEAGKGGYAKNCTSCHGAKLEGQKQWQRADTDGIFPAPPHDKSGMPAFGDRLTDA